MTDKYAIDVATARPAAADIKHSGYTALIGYLSGGLDLGGLPKDMPTKYEEELLSADVHTGRVWETSAQAALGGAVQGNIDGQVCLQECEGKCSAAPQVTSYPMGSPLWVNIGDFAATLEQINLIVAYYTAFFKACPGYQQGGYGTGYIIDELVKAGCNGSWWQNAMDDSGVSGSVVSPHASMYQRVSPTKPPIPGGGYDEDVYGFGPQPPRFRSLAAKRLAAPDVTATAEYKLTLRWPAVPGAVEYQYQVEVRDFIEWKAVVADATTTATEVTIPVAKRGTYRHRAASGGTIHIPGSGWSYWKEVSV